MYSTLTWYLRGMVTKGVVTKGAVTAGHGNQGHVRWHHDIRVVGRGDEHLRHHIHAPYSHR